MLTLGRRIDYAVNPPLLLQRFSTLKKKKTKYLAGVETPTSVPSYLKFMSRSPLPKRKYYSGKVVCLTHSHLVYIECLLEFNSLSYTFRLEAVPKISLSAPSEFFILGLILSPIDSIKL